MTEEQEMITLLRTDAALARDGLFVWPVATRLAEAAAMIERLLKERDSWAETVNRQEQAIARAANDVAEACARAAKAAADLNEATDYLERTHDSWLNNRLGTAIRDFLSRMEKRE